MKVFLSWSGERSRKVAVLLNDWISQVIQAVEPWISTDIEKGARWSEEISSSLEQTKVGIICLTKDNLKSEWILFEAGALSKTKDAIVCTFLLDVNATDVTPPLSIFQNTKFEKEDLRKLLHSINKKIEESGERPIPEKTLNQAFEKFYPELKEELEKIIHETFESKTTKRPDRDILEEILETVRSIKNTPALINDLGHVPSIKDNLMQLGQAVVLTREEVEKIIDKSPKLERRGSGSMRGGTRESRRR